jgi:hypothetical protein
MNMLKKVKDQLESGVLEIESDGIIARLPMSPKLIKHMKKMVADYEKKSTKLVRELLRQHKRHDRIMDAQR